MSAAIEQFGEKIEKLAGICTEMLYEIKRMGEVQGGAIKVHDSRIATVENDLKNASSARREIYKRLEAIEKNCVYHHGLNGYARPHDHNNIVESWIGKKLTVAVGIALGTVCGALGMKLLEKLL